MEKQIIGYKYYYSKPLYQAVTVLDSTGFSPNVIQRKGKVSNMPRMTVCAAVYDDDTMSFGVAVCSSKDQFVKAIGRNLAQERAINNPVLTVDIDEGVFFDAIFNLQNKYL